MANYTIRQVRVQVEYADGRLGWFAAEFPDGCRTVVAGLDAYGTAGTYFEPPPGRQGLVPVAGGSARDAGTLSAEGARSAKEVAAADQAAPRRPEAGATQAPSHIAHPLQKETLQAKGFSSVSSALSAEEPLDAESESSGTELAPPICEYRNGRWYCW